MHLAAFVSAGPVSGSHGGWRQPDADRDFTSLGYYTRLARILEDGCFDFASILCSWPTSWRCRTG